jgi:hypothetical protein
MESKMATATAIESAAEMVKARAASRRNESLAAELAARVQYVELLRSPADDKKAALRLRDIADEYKIAPEELLADAARVHSVIQAEKIISRRPEFAAAAAQCIADLRALELKHAEEMEAARMATIRAQDRVREIDYREREIHEVRSDRPWLFAEGVIPKLIDEQ